MEDIYTQLTIRTFKLLNEIPYNHRLIISISGSPGSGKKLIANVLQKKINKLAHRYGFLEYDEQLCCVIPQELFRVTRPDLVKLTESNRQLMMLRDVPKLYKSSELLNLVNFLHQEVDELRTPSVYIGEKGISTRAEVTRAESTGNAAEGSVANGHGNGHGNGHENHYAAHGSNTAYSGSNNKAAAHGSNANTGASHQHQLRISPSCRIIIIKGSYVQLKDPIWNDIANLVEERWFLRVKPQIAKKRLMKKYLVEGIVNNVMEAEKMWNDVDSIKRDYVITHTLMPDLIVDNNSNTGLNL